jgi:hypothetical protein
LNSAPFTAPPDRGGAGNHCPVRPNVDSGPLEQYKHPCLINDLDFRKTMPVEEEVGEENS